MPFYGFQKASLSQFSIRHWILAESKWQLKESAAQKLPFTNNNFWRGDMIFRSTYAFYK